MTLIIFTEEPSMKEALSSILNKLGIGGGSFRIIAFDGVGNLEKALPMQLRAISPNDRILILRDNDCGNCSERKKKITLMADSAGKLGITKVRIVCQMLESWFLGDANALRNSRYLEKPVPKRLCNCDPDQQLDPKRELGRLRRGYNAISGARAIAPHLNIEENRSQSFQHTINAIRYLIAN